MPKMTEVVVDSVRVSLTNPQRIVILHEPSSERYLPIWIGPYEAESITIALQEVEVARPQTHDLLKNILQKMDAHLLRIEIVALQDDVFFANLIIDKDGELFEIDSRPSDAVALAVRMHVPILVNQEVLDVAGITPEQEVKPETPAPTETPPTTQFPESEAGEKRLSVFEDFLDKLDLDDNPPASEGDKDDLDDNPQKP